MENTGEVTLNTIDIDSMTVASSSQQQQVYTSTPRRERQRKRFKDIRKSDTVDRTLHDLRSKKIKLTKTKANIADMEVDGSRQ